MTKKLGLPSPPDNRRVLLNLLMVYGGLFIGGTLLGLFIGGIYGPVIGAFFGITLMAAMSIRDITKEASK